MARSFRRKQQAHPIAELNITNLVDLGFTLLIIFMIATPLINKEQTMPVVLPKESSSAKPTPDPTAKHISVSINAKGEFALDSRAVGSISELGSLLAAHANDEKKPVIHIRADAKVPYEKVIQVMDELKKNNLTNISFDTQTDS